MRKNNHAKECKICNGTGSTHSKVRGSWIICHACHGTGKEHQYEALLDYIKAVKGDYS